MKIIGQVFSDRILVTLKAPGKADDSKIVRVKNAMRDAGSGLEFGDFDGVPSLFEIKDDQGRDITGKVKAFYEEHPFPSYEGLEEFSELVSRGNANPFSKRLLDAIGINKTILECGCGTGQLSNYLQLNNNHVLGIDMSISSLKLAIEHKQRNNLERSAFCQMNIFDLAVKDSSFDVVIAHGVLHHTYDARKAFAHIVKKVKPGGIVMVGLYNSYARLPTWLRSKVINLLGPNIDFVVRKRINDARKAEIWIKDQYFNPHETWHSIGEIMKWFKEEGVEFLNCQPAIMGTDGEIGESIFDESGSGNAYLQVMTQLSWLATIAREGALFDLIGRRKA